MQPGHRPQKHHQASEEAIRRYAELAGCLLWLHIAIRPDISYAATFSTRWTSAPTP
ncbi:hypothetical protein BK809_0002677 [Diplodia seriata]|uniref:Uncharacterized protein n=1 Tax=Diplodia seriata TaxID=420778 RepID=A0A1S8B2R1_9PEZI|nr:hypothetical protein BK809_0002677 [Diplodia seriata]